MLIFHKTLKYNGSGSCGLSYKGYYVCFGWLSGYGVFMENERLVVPAARANLDGSVLFVSPLALFSELEFYRQLGEKLKL